MRVRSIVAGACVMCVAGTAPAQPQARLDYRFLVQEITGSGATREVAPAPDLIFNAGSRVRLTVQYKLENLNADGDDNPGTDGPRVNWLYGYSGATLSISGSGIAPGGTLNRSSLTTSGLPAPGGAPLNGESSIVNNSGLWPWSLPPAAPLGQMYPQSGTSPVLSGLHQPFRDALFGNDNALNHGVISGSSITNIVALSLAGGSGVNQLEHNWWGHYSFEFASSAAQDGPVVFSLATALSTLQVIRGTVSPENDGQGSASFTMLGQGQFELGALPSVTLVFQVPAPGSGGLVLCAAAVLARSRMRAARHARSED